MTEKELREKIVSLARSYLGTVEGDANHKHILSVYNSHSPLARGYKVQSKDAWCATFVSFVFIEAGMPNLIVTECGCEEMINKNKAIFIENDAHVPTIGDIIMYDWQDSGSGDNTGYADHIGIVESVSNGMITVIEGNKNDAVQRRTIAVNGKYIRGFIVPKYASLATTTEAPATPTDSAPSTTPKFIGRVTASSLNVRTDPFVGSSNIYKPCSSLENGRRVEVCDERNGWYYIRIVREYGSNGCMAHHFAWVSGKYIKKV